MDENNISISSSKLIISILKETGMTRNRHISGMAIGILSLDSRCPFFSFLRSASVKELFDTIQAVTSFAGYGVANINCIRKRGLRAEKIELVQRRLSRARIPSIIERIVSGHLSSRVPIVEETPQAATALTMSNAMKGKNPICKVLVQSRPSVKFRWTSPGR